MINDQTIEYIEYTDEIEIKAGVFSSMARISLLQGKNMHTDNLNKWQHNHNFDKDSSSAQKGVSHVILLTLTMMIIEIAAGYYYKSMALLADGWHMGTHAAALGITLFAYIYANRHKSDKLFTFGTGKVSVLGGYTSAIILGLIALLMIYESIKRLLFPQDIQFNQALLVACIGLVVNVLSAFLLIKNPSHDHGHHHDHNLKAAYIHVLADALTSILAIIALTFGKLFGWWQLDPVMGIVGAFVIMVWAKGLLYDTSAILLDKGTDKNLIDKIYTRIESDSDNRIADLHLWNINSKKMSAIISIVTHKPRNPDHYKTLLKDIDGLAHISVEIIACKAEERFDSQKAQPKNA